MNNIYNKIHNKIHDKIKFTKRMFYSQILFIHYRIILINKENYENSIIIILYN